MQYHIKRQQQKNHREYFLLNPPLIWNLKKCKLSTLNWMSKIELFTTRRNKQNVIKTDKLILFCLAAQNSAYLIFMKKVFFGSDLVFVWFAIFENIWIVFVTQVILVTLLHGWIISSNVVLVVRGGWILMVLFCYF